MSSVELLKHVKALPPRERQRFLLAILTFEESPREPRRGKAPRANWPDLGARARCIFGTRVLPNLVLAERGEEEL